MDFQFWSPCLLLFVFQVKFSLTIKEIRAHYIKSGKEKERQKKKKPLLTLPPKDNIEVTLVRLPSQCVFSTIKLYLGI